MRRERLIYVALLLITVAVFWPVSRCEFINYDDQDYIAGNPQIQRGLGASSVAWAFRAIIVGNWHPVTCLSHLLDWQLFGNNAGAHHLINLLYHVANVLLLFHVWRRMTHECWLSALVAAFFAWHPLHVESVAWLSERKDLLSTFWGLLAIWAYSRYAQHNALKLRIEMYLLAIFFFALGLMSKPMLVTWPFVLLLLDFWPLKRIPSGKTQGSSCQTLDSPHLTLRHLVVEKLPFFVMALTSGVTTFLVQRHAGAMSPASYLPVSERIGNALISYLRYLGKTIWPSQLAIFYPYPGPWPTWQVIGAAALLVLVAVAVARQARRRPFLIVGWLWFLGTLVPVIGLVKVGDQAMADRYTYIPLIGLFVMVVWGVKDFAKRWHREQPVLGAAAATALAACIVITSLQLRHWRDSEALFRHALDVTKGNALAHFNLGSSLVEKGQFEEGMANLIAARRMNPAFAQVHGEIARAFARQGKIHESVSSYYEALSINTNLPEALNNLAWLLATSEDTSIRNGAEAVRLAERACALTRNRKTICIGTLAAAYAEVGRYDDAIKTAERACASAMASGEEKLAETNRRLLKLYRAGQPYREPTNP